MYIRPVHACLDEEALKSFIRENPLGLLTTSIPSRKFHKIQTSHIPFVLDEPPPSSSSDDTSSGGNNDDAEQGRKSLGRLRGHMARANPQSKTIIEHLKSDGVTVEAKDDEGGEYLQEEVLILFNSQNQHYISPKYYKETKPETGKVVPTWNYAAVEVYGRAKIYHDTRLESTGQYLDTQINDLSNQRESNLIKEKSESSSSKNPEVEKETEKEKETGWKVSDAPSSYIDLLKKAIIGIEIEVISMEGRFKLSQEMGEKDRDGVVEGLKELGTDSSLGVAKGVETGGKSLRR